MDKPPLDTLVPQRRGVGRWPVTLTTERANPLRQWNPDWGECSTARRPVAAVNTLFLRRSDFVKRLRVPVSPTLASHEPRRPGIELPGDRTPDRNLRRARGRRRFHRC